MQKLRSLSPKRKAKSAPSPKHHDSSSGDDDGNTHKNDAANNSSEEESKKPPSPSKMSRLQKLRMSRNKAKTQSTNTNSSDSDDDDGDKKKKKANKSSSDNSSDNDDERQKKTPARPSSSPSSRLSRLRLSRKKKDEKKQTSRRSRKDSNSPPPHSSEEEPEGKLSPMRGFPRGKKPTSRRRRGDGIVNENQAELHIIGSVSGGRDFDDSKGGGGYSVKWAIEYGETWIHVSGDYMGHTHTDSPSLPEADIVWAHPIDLHFAADSVQGWPRIQLQVYKLDCYGRTDVVGYGFTNIPCTPGSHTVEVQCWRPMGSSREEIEAFFIGGNVQLLSDDVLFTKAWADRCRLKTVSSGTVFLELDILARNFPETSGL